MILKKKKYKVNSLTVNIRGRSNLEEYCINSVLKHSKADSSSFKSLNQLKSGHVSAEYLSFFLKNKQVLRGVESFIGNFPKQNKATTSMFLNMLNRMKRLRTLNSIAKLIPNSSIRKRNYRFTFKKENNPILLSSDGKNKLLKLLYPFQKVEKATFCPGIGFKNLFPHIDKVEVDLKFLNQVKEIPVNIGELTITDERETEIESLPSEKELKYFCKFQALKSLCLRIANKENSFIFGMFDFLPEKELNLYFDFDPSVLMLNKSLADSVLRFIGKTHSKIYFILQDISRSETSNYLSTTTSTNILKAFSFHNKGHLLNDLFLNSTSEGNEIKRSDDKENTFNSQSCQVGNNKPESKTSPNGSHHIVYKSYNMLNLRRLL